MNTRESRGGLILFGIAVLLLLIAMLMGNVSYHAHAATAPVRVPADVEWVSTGRFVEAGQTVYLLTKGRASTAPLDQYPKSISSPNGQVSGLGCGQYPEAPPPCGLDDAPYGALIGRVGPSGEPFLIGGASSFIAPATGNLFLIVNDNLGFYSDNGKGFTIWFTGR
jgi:hypothetical protein